MGVRGHGERRRSELTHQERPESELAEEQGSPAHRGDHRYLWYAFTIALLSDLPF